MVEAKSSHLNWWGSTPCFARLLSPHVQDEWLSIGGQMGNEERRVVCENGHPTRTGDNFCHECGASLTSQSSRRRLAWSVRLRVDLAERLRSIADSLDP